MFSSKPLSILKFPPKSTAAAAPAPAPAKKASFISAEAPASAAEAVNAARRSQRVSLLGGLDKDHFNAARDMRDASTALALSYWLAEETKIPVRGDAKLFLEDLHSGVVLCVLGNKISADARFKFHNPPTNEFQRLENFELFNKSLKPLKLSSQPPSAKKNELSAYLPCLLELAMRAGGDDGSSSSSSSSSFATAAGDRDVSKYFCVLCRGSTAFDTTAALMDHLERNHANLNISERDAHSHGGF